MKIKTNTIELVEIDSGNMVKTIERVVRLLERYKDEGDIRVEIKVRVSFDD